MKQSRGWAAFLAALIAFAPLHAVRADEQTDQVKEHLAKAKVHYDLGEFDDAAEEYIQAYRIKPISGALYNIAQAYRLGHDYSSALRSYRSYLRRLPNAPNRGVPSALSVPSCAHFEVRTW